MINYDFLFNLLKTCEQAADTSKPYGFNFTAHGKNENIKFRMYFGRGNGGEITFEPLKAPTAIPEMETPIFGNQDMANIAKQLQTLEVSSNRAEVVMSVFDALLATGWLHETHYSVDRVHSISAYRIKVRSMIVHEGMAYGALEVSFIVAKASGWPGDTAWVSKADKKPEAAKEPAAAVQPGFGSNTTVRNLALAALARRDGSSVEMAGDTYQRIGTIDNNA